MNYLKLLILVIIIGTFVVLFVTFGVIVLIVGLITLPFAKYFLGKKKMEFRANRSKPAGSSRTTRTRKAKNSGKVIEGEFEVVDDGKK